MVVYGLILHVTTHVKSVQKFGVSEDTLKLIKKWQ